MVENLVGYAKADLLVAAGAVHRPGRGANTAAAEWCAEVNAAMHSEICAVPAERLRRGAGAAQRVAVAAAAAGPRPMFRKVDKLSCVRFGSARYSVPDPADRAAGRHRRRRRPDRASSSR